MTSRIRPCRVRGFTLMEILAALVLLSLLMLAVFSGIRIAMHSVRFGQQFTARTDAVRATQDFMRRELAQAIRQPWGLTDDRRPIVFTGGPDQVQYVAPLPGYLGRLGPQLQTLKLVPESDGDGYRLQVSFALLPPDGSRPQPFGKPQVLLTGIRSGQFSYRGRQRNHHPTGWTERWQDTARTPVLVRLELKLRHGDWPLMLAPIRIDASAVQGAGGIMRHMMQTAGGQR
jgi:general secretion pathway protein J